ncbi:MAG TPA: hypothetical protein VN802_13830 [Stellaceae bacterium]|nr:hypothetical protein [Stellaceae bacterium]
MTSHWFAGAIVLAITTSGALAQGAPLDATNSTQPNLSTNGPAGTYDMTKTRRTIDSSGVTTDTTQTFDKSQTYTGGNGALSAKTSIETSGATTTTLPSPNPPKETTK